MLSEKRIKEAEKNVKRYLDENLITKKPVNEPILKILLKNSKDSLGIAANLLESNRSDLWVIVTSYYSMFYIANAILLKCGYKVGDKIAHKVTADALIVLIKPKLEKSLIDGYEEAMDEALAGIKSEELISSFDYERIKRNTVQYNMSVEVKHSKAKTSLERAKHFYFEILKLITD